MTQSSTYYQCTVQFKSREDMEGFFALAVIQDEKYEALLRLCDFDIHQNIMRLDVRMNKVVWGTAGFIKLCRSLCFPDGPVYSLRTPSRFMGLGINEPVPMMGKISYDEVMLEIRK